jgi:2-polyprenyl-6-methoxyphenol hydroxylase-like FAD-dependent oxidoreductase
MKKQRICIVGDGLSVLLFAIAINILQTFVVHFIDKKKELKNDKRTTAISHSNFNFIKDIMSKFDKKLFWPSKKINLFYETRDQKINFLNFKEDKNNLMYVFQNKKIKDFLFKEIKKRKIRIIKKNITKISDLKFYDLKVLCLGRSSVIYDNIIDSRSIDKDYKEIAMTGCVKHNLKKVSTSQFFLKEGPLALLPFSKNKLSFVWSLNKNFIKKDINNIIKSKISEILKTKNNIDITNLQSYPLILNLKRTYYKKDVLILGEGLHSVHPLAGQGFNLVLRDIKKLKEILKYYSGLGLSIKNSFALEEFTNQRKPENIITGLGIDMTHNFFKKNKLFEPIKELILKNVSKYGVLKKMSKLISNQGLSS